MYIQYVELQTLSVLLSLSLCLCCALQMLHHLQRRKDAREIWGCRHMVEVRHGESREEVCTGMQSLRGRLFEPHSRSLSRLFLFAAGLHPNGIPCHKKKNVKFESITRDVHTHCMKHEALPPSMLTHSMIC